MRLTMRSGASRARAMPRAVSTGPKRLASRVAVLAASVVLIVAGSLVAPTAAEAATYPTWGDVQKAKASEAATRAEVARVTALVKSLESRSAAAQAAATAAGDTLQAAQQAFFLADQNYKTLKSAADTKTSAAGTATARAGRLAAELYRSGGHNMSLALVLSSQRGSGSDPSALLGRLGSMSKLTESSSQLWDQAQQAKNVAAAASAQAKSALDERGRLQQQAQTALTAAVQTSASAQQAVLAEQSHSDELNAMLAALKNTTAKTVGAYEKGVQVRAAEARARQLAAERAAAARASAVSGFGWAVPVAGEITAGFGPRPAPCAGCSTWHEGVDIAAPFGTPIHSAHEGTVVYAGWYGGYGNFILVDNGDGMSTAYGHNIDGGIVVSMGQHVSAGQVIGHVGSTGHSTGAHLHFEVRQNGVQINPIPWMAQHGAAL